MTPQLWQQVKDVLDGALAHEGAARERFLNQACLDHAELRAEVESLLVSYEDAGGFIDTPIASAKAALSSQSATPANGERRIGSYRVTGLIGEGGMGAVYRAVRDDDQYKKTVAIKVLKRGMDTAFIVGRFRTERQILASLDHPHIARLFDGGSTDDGLPFFVMEHIEGVPLVEYCNKHRLAVRERLELFQKVCLAVQYAHQNLIVHRDLKPGNILVTEDGAPKLLDFGIAKLLTPDSAPVQTVTLVRMLTPEYASPEQIRGEAINTASDVYSLGVILYELLTGRRPYHLRTRAPHEVAQIVCEVDPTRPSTAVKNTEEVKNNDGKVEYTLTPELISYDRGSKPDRLRRALSGDLDNIVMMAMRKDRDRRYASAGQLEEDIRCHLTGQPVVAQADTFDYRFRKFVGRHQAAVIAATLGVLALVAGLVGTIWQGRQAQIERARAERRFNDVRRLANSVVFEIHDAIAKLPGSTAARELIAKQATTYLDALSKEAGNTPDLEFELAMAYQRIAEVQGAPAQANLGKVGEALISAEKSRSILDGLVRKHPSNIEYQRGLSTAWDQLAEFQRLTGHADKALEADERNLAIRQKLYDANPSDMRNLAALGVSYGELGNDYTTKGDFQKVLELRRKVASIFEQVLERQPTKKNKSNLAIALKRLAGVEAKLGDYNTALQSLRRAAAIEGALLVEDPNNAAIEMGLSYTYGDTGYNYGKLARYPEAVEWYRKSLAIRERLSKADPKDVRARNAVATSHNRLGFMLANDGQSDEAIREERISLASSEKMAAEFPDIPDYRRDVVAGYTNMGDINIILAKSPRTAGPRARYWRQAREWYIRALALAEDIEMKSGKDGAYLDLRQSLRKLIDECTGGLEAASQARASAAQ